MVMVVVSRWQSVMERIKSGKREKGGERDEEAFGCGEVEGTFGCEGVFNYNK